MDSSQDIQKRTQPQSSSLTNKEDLVIEWENVEIDDKLASLISMDSLDKYRFIPFEMDHDRIRVAVVDENDINTQNALRFFGNRNNKEIEIHPISLDDFNLLMTKVKNPAAEIGKVLDDFEKRAQLEEARNLTRKKGEEGLNILKDAPVAKMVEVIIKNAIDGLASDIHIEPMDDFVRVRYRVDGILYNSITLPKKIGPAIVSRIKILSNLKIDEKRKPQDGRFRIKDLGRTIDFRVSTFPISYGEKLVMRILDTKAGVITMDKLGIFGRDEKLLRKVADEPHGIILVTGPTGSGKSTTLYSVLKILNKEGINIVTLEDPVEYVLDGVNQSQVKPEIDYTFASGLRSILRQDPDVVMVGEIRDEETAELAIHAALTGHLVLSTLHTNSAIGAIARLIDMGIQPFLLTSSLNLLMAQRLVRSICSDCKKEIIDPPEEAKKMVKDELTKLPKIRKDDLKGLGVDIDNPKLYKGEGCNSCQGSGMKGRLGIFEMIEINDRISKMIGDGKSEVEIEQEAVRFGYTTMKQDGIMKVVQGYTTIEEVQRVTEENSEDEEVIE